MTAAEKRIGVGLIGLSAEGGWAATAHVPALRAMAERYAITGLAASSDTAAAAAAAVHGVAFATGDAALLAAHPDVDLVVVAVKVPRHRELVSCAIDAGKSVYCEWPLGRSVTEAEGMADAAGAKGVSAFAGLQARSAPALRYLRDLVADGFVGDLLSTSVIGAGGFPWGGMATARTAYVTDAETGATMLTIPFGHMVDAFGWIVGSFDRLDATLATCHRDVKLTDEDRTVAADAPDHIAVSGTLEGGAVASLHYRGGDWPSGGFRWEMNGADGTLLVEGRSGHLQYGHIRIRGARGSRPLTDLPVPGQYRRVSTDADGYADAVAHAYRAVHDDLTGGGSTAPTFRDAIETHRVLDRIERSAARSLERTS